MSSISGSIDIHPGLQSSPIAPAPSSVNSWFDFPPNVPEGTVTSLSMCLVRNKGACTAFFISSLTGNKESKALHDTLIKNFSYGPTNRFNKTNRYMRFISGAVRRRLLTDIERVIQAVRRVSTGQ